MVSRSLAPGEAGEAGQGWELWANYILPPGAVVVTASGSCKEALGSSLLCLTSPLTGPCLLSPLLFCPVALQGLPCPPLVFPGRAVGKLYPETPTQLYISSAEPQMHMCHGWNTLHLPLGSCSFILRPHLGLVSTVFKASRAESVLAATH